MTGPNQPTPRPLPNPGPPPAPVVGMDPVNSVPLCEHGDDAAACQLRHPPVAKSQETICDEHKAQYFYSGYEAGKRDALEENQPAPTAGAGPTHPPGHPGTGSPPPPPPPTQGHLPPGADCDCGHGDLDQMFHLPPCPRARPVRTPTLGMVIRDAERLLSQAMSVLERQWDPTSGPQQDGGVLPAQVDMALGAARTEVRIARMHLGDIASLGLPPVGSAVQYPGPSDSRSSLSGGSASHLAPAPWASGVRPEPTPPPGLGADGFTLPHAKPVPSW